MRKHKKMLVMLAILVILTPLITGCYVNKGVEQFERGLKLKAGTEIEQIVGPGRYTNFGWYSQMPTVNVSALKVEWTDPDLVTRDKQPIGLSVSVTFARKSDSDSVAAMWEEYNYEARDDEALRQQVLARIPRAAKEMTTQFTLDEMLGVSEGDDTAGRQALQNSLADILDDELAEIYVELKDVGVNNIAPDATYLELLTKKANAVVQREVAKEQAETAKEDLKREKEETKIQLELASRERLVQEEKAKVFTANPQWFELKRLEALQGIFGQNDKIWFIDPNADVTLIMSGENIVPVGE